MNDEKNRLEQIKRLVAEGKVEIGNAAAKTGGRSVHAVPGDAPGTIVLQWSRPGVGFGELVLHAQADGKLWTDREGMSVTFCLDVLRQALEEGVG